MIVGKDSGTHDGAGNARVWEKRQEMSLFSSYSNFSRMNHDPWLEQHYTQEILTPLFAWL